MLSFIIPAHNEERWIGKCLGSIREAMEEIAEPFEVIVVDDASTDATHQIAEQMGARTLRVELRLIAAVRNAGVRVAMGRTFSSSTPTPRRTNRPFARHSTLSELA